MSKDAAYSKIFRKAGLVWGKGDADAARVLVAGRFSLHFLHGCKIDFRGVMMVPRHVTWRCIAGGLVHPVGIEIHLSRPDRIRYGLQIGPTGTSIPQKRDQDECSCPKPNASLRTHRRFSCIM